MGHDEHFLQRLDRLSDAHLEMALMLYRAPEVVRDAIESAGIGPHAERVLLALDAQELGPRVLVARDGGFVTCLGAGMANGPWPRVSRAALDASIGRFARGRQLYDEISKHSMPQWHAKFERLMSAGPWMTREEMASMRVIADMMPFQNVRALIELTTVWRKMRDKLVAAPAGATLDDAHRRGLWRTYWALQHHASLCAMNASTIWTIMDEQAALHEGSLRESMLALLVAPISTCTEAGMFRGVQMAVRGGKPALHTAKRALSPQTLLPWRELSLATATLVAHASNRGKLSVEAEKAVRLSNERREVFHRQQVRETTLVEVQRFLCSNVVDLLQQDPAQSEAHAREAAWAALDPAQRATFGQAKDLPVELVAALAASSSREQAEPESLFRAMLAAPWMAKAQPEDFYLPEAHKKLAFSRFIDDGECVWKLVRAAKTFTFKLASKTVNHGRNALCRCGSGRKSKRCCAEALAA